MLTSDERRKLIVDQLSNKKHIITISQIEELSKSGSYEKFLFKGSRVGCGDTLSFCIKRNSQGLEEIFFSDEEACIITVSATNMICLWLDKFSPSFYELSKLLLNIRKMINGNDYDLQNCPEMEAFHDLNLFASRIDCLELVIRSFEEIIKSSLSPQ